MKRILFFMAGNVPTSAEQTTLDKLNTLAAKPYEVTTLNAKAQAVYAEPNGLIPCDYVVGDAPAVYSEVPVFDPDAPPIVLPADQAIVTGGQTFQVAGGPTIIASVTDGVLTFGTVV